MKAKLTEKDKADIVRLVGLGKAIAVLAEDFGVTEQAIRYTVKKAAKDAKKGKRFAAAAPLDADRALGEALDEFHGAPGSQHGPAAAQDPATLTGLCFPLPPAPTRRTQAAIKMRSAARDFMEEVMRDEITQALNEVFGRSQGADE